jgi:hypothetical protein
MILLHLLGSLSTLGLDPFYQDLCLVSIFFLARRIRAVNNDFFSQSNPRSCISVHDVKNMLIVYLALHSSHTA